MAMIFNLGSINTDHFYRLPHLPEAGETLAATAYERGLGGKGANQSVALARAGANVRHIGAVGADGLWMIDRMVAAGVDCRHVQQSDAASGHAIINIDVRAENTIILYPGANRAISRDWVTQALLSARSGDVLVMQNETAHQVGAAQFAQKQGLKVIYSAAPFEAGAVRDVLPFISVLILNAVEAAQLCAALGVTLAQVPVAQILVTHGADGAVLYDLASGREISVPAFKVEAIDTSGAGDTFAGFFVAGLAEGMAPEAAMRFASAASAIKVTRAGTADAIPSRAEVEQFLSSQPSE